MSSAPWYRAVLGDELVRWCTPAPGAAVGEPPPLARVAVEEALAGDVEAVALYFPPLLGDDLADRLLELCRSVKGRLRVVQVLTPLAGATSPTSPTSPMSPVSGGAPRPGCWPPAALLDDLEVPWFAVPPDDFDRQRRLCGRFRVQADVAASRLLLLDGRSGRLVTRSGRERLLADPRGLAFPWPARPLAQALAAAKLQPSRQPTATGSDLLDDLRSSDGPAVLGVYFSAHWCPPCKAFTPQLVSAYNAVRARGQRFEVLFVSSDRSEESFEQYARSMPWPSVAWTDAAARQELAALLAVQGIPTLVLLDQDLNVIADDARASVNDDPEGKDYPWRPEAVSLFTERLATRLHDHPALILFVEGAAGEVEWATSVLKQAADVYAERHPPSQAALREPRLQFLVAQDGDAADGLREQLVLEDAVPLLVAVDACRGVVSVLEDEADDEDACCAVSAPAAVAFMEAFLAGDLPSAPIGVHLPPCRPHHALLQDAQPLEA